MTIHRLFQKTALQPEDIERLVDAHQRTLRALGLKDRDDPLTQAVAKKIKAGKIKVSATCSLGKK